MTSCPTGNFAVKTADFDAVARDIPDLIAPMDPLGQQWEPLGHFPEYQVLLRGPTKVEYLFLDQVQERMLPQQPSRETLGSMNTHYWDWTWWLVTKASTGRHDLVAEHLPQLHEHLLAPMGVAVPPDSLDASIAAFVERRDMLEREYHVTLPRNLENEVLEGKARVLGQR